ncbi:MAG: hypothetical protein U1E08_03515 [Coriobacteriia bacterium]|nr:hypothetical protein [Actinomycetota bacterium]MDZ4166747.1 hypothetical protein [Coriobacteriia bacterium]
MKPMRSCLVGWILGLALAWLPSMLRVSHVAWSGLRHGVAEANPLPVLFHVVLLLLPFDLARALLVDTAWSAALYWLGVLVVGTLMQSLFKTLCRDRSFSKGVLAAAVWSGVIAISPVAYYLPHFVRAGDASPLSLVAGLVADSVMIFLPGLVILGLVCNALSNVVLGFLTKLQSRPRR